MSRPWGRYMLNRRMNSLSTAKRRGKRGVRYKPEISTEVSSCRAFRPAVPSLFGTRDCFLGSHFFHEPVVGGGFRMLQAHHAYCALYFCYCYTVTLWWCEGWGVARNTDESSLACLLLISCCVSLCPGPRLLCNPTLGHSENFAFYSRQDGNPLEDFKQKSNTTCLIS